MAEWKFCARWAPVAMAALVGIAGCASSPEPVPYASYAQTAQGQTWVKVLDAALADTNISDRQRSIIEEAKKTGTITFDDFQSAVNDTAACVRERGGSLTGPTVVTYAGITSIEYTTSEALDEASLEAADKEMTSCADTYSTAIQTLWDGTPSNIALRDEAFARIQPQIEACLTAHDVQVPKGATYDQVLKADFDLSHATSGTVSCSTDAGWWGN